MSKENVKVAASTVSAEAVVAHVEKTNEALGLIRKSSHNLFQVVKGAYVELRDDDEMFKSYKKQLDCDSSSIAKILKIVKNGVIMANLDQLPSSWGTLSSLTTLNSETLQKMISDGAVTRTSTLKEVRETKAKYKNESYDPSTESNKDENNDSDSSSDTPQNSDDVVEEYSLNTMYADLSVFEKPEVKEHVVELLEELQDHGFHIEVIESPEPAKSA